MPYPTSSSGAFEAYRVGETTIEVSMLVQMVLVVRGFRTKLDERLRAINQSAARMETLSAIINMQGPVSQSDVARRLRVEGATITRMIDLLSAEGLVERGPHPSDRRINLLQLTPLGEQELEKIFRVYDFAREDLLSDLSPDDIAELHRMTKLMLERLDRPAQSPIKIDDLPPQDRLNDRLSDLGRDPERDPGPGRAPE